MHWHSRRDGCGNIHVPGLRNRAPIIQRQRTVIICDHTNDWAHITVTPEGWRTKKRKGRNLSDRDILYSTPAQKRDEILDPVCNIVMPRQEAETWTQSNTVHEDTKS